MRVLGLGLRVFGLGGVGFGWVGWQWGLHLTWKWRCGNAGGAGEPDGGSRSGRPMLRS